MKSEQQHKRPFERAHSDFQSLKASEALRERIANHFSETPIQPTSQIRSKAQTNHAHRRWPLWQRTAVSAAAVLLSLGLTLGVAVNVSPTFADAVSAVPGLAGVVKVLTFGRYQVNDGGYQVNIDTPQIQGLLDSALQEKLNTEFKEYANTLIAGVESDISDLKVEFGDEDVHFGVDSGYEILTNDSRYLAIDLYLVNTVGSSTTLYKFYTVDKSKQQVLTLETAIWAMLTGDETGQASDGAAIDSAKVDEALNKIEGYILEQMRSQMDQGKSVYWLDDPGMMPEDLVNRESLFYINSDHQLVIAFEEYSVAPGSEGTPKFVIPRAVIEE